MKEMKRIVLLWQSIVLYGVVGLILRGSTTKGWNLPFMSVYWWILVPGFLIIKDIFLFGQQGRVQSVELTTFSRWSVETDINRWTVPQWYAVTIIARKYLFPIFLTLYLLYLLVEQTQVWELHTSLLFLATSKSFLMLATIIIGVVMMFWEKYDKNYERPHRSIEMWWVYFVMTSFLSIVWWYIVLKQLIELNMMGMVMANLVIVLLYLVWVLLFEGEKSDA